jgi:hypothetical protein
VPVPDESVPPSGAVPIDPQQVLLPGRSDAARLTRLWLVRRACTGLLFLGVIVGIVIAGAGGDSADLAVDTDSTESVLSGVLSSFGLVFAAIVLRFVTGWVALALAYPVAREHQGPPEPQSGLLRRVSLVVDRYGITRAFRELRWTDGVRVAAIGRLGEAGDFYTRVDRAIGVANVVAVVLCVPAIMTFGFTIQM